MKSCRNPRAPAPRQEGALLVESLVAIALLGAAALSLAASLSLARALSAEAARLERASAAAAATLGELEEVPFAGLPSRLGVSRDARLAELASHEAAAPASWRERAARLPEGRLVVRARALARGGGVASFSAARALRVEVELSWREGALRRRVALVTVRT